MHYCHAQIFFVFFFLSLFYFWVRISVAWASLKPTQECATLPDPLTFPFLKKILCVKVLDL